MADDKLDDTKPEGEPPLKKQRTESNDWSEWESKDGKTKNDWNSGWKSSGWKDGGDNDSNKESGWKTSGWSKSSWNKEDGEKQADDKEKQDTVKKEESGLKSSGWSKSSWNKEDGEKQADDKEKQDTDKKEESGLKSSGWSKSYSSWSKADGEKKADDKKQDADEDSGKKSNGLNQSSSWSTNDGASNNDWGKKTDSDWTWSSWKNDSRKDWKKNAGGAIAVYSEREENYWKYEHGSWEWKDAVMQGMAGCKFKPGDELMSRVSPGDFIKFADDDCSKWRNKPLVLTSTESFWVFGKSVNWVCSNTSSKQIKEFLPGKVGSWRNVDRCMLVDGSLPAYIVATYGKEYPFVCQNTETYDVGELKEAGLQKAGFGLLHRLDRETSGPLLVAKTQEAFKRLVSERDNHNWHKEYVTLCHGLIPADKYKGVIDIPLRRKLTGSSSFIVDACGCWKKPKYGRHGKRVKCSRGEDSEGYRCLGETKSYYEVVKYFHHTNKQGVKHDYTFVRIKLVSGKTHQIRVHMRLFGRELNLPVYGVCSDFKYLQDNFPEAYKSDCDELCSRVFLHSVVLGFRDPDDPFTNRVAQFKLQNDLMTTLRKLGSNDKAFEDVIRHQTELQEDKVAKFALEFGLNSDAEEAVRRALCGDELMGAFYKQCPDPSKKPAARSFNGDHSAMTLRVLENYQNDMEALDEIVSREFPELIKRDDENLKLPPGWVKKKSRNILDAYYYFHSKLNVVQIEHPARAEMDGLPPGWRRMESKSKPGQFYYYDSNTSTSHVELPSEVKDYKSAFGNVSWKISPTSSPSAGPRVQHEWMRRESTKQAGCFYWFHPGMNRTSVHHPLGLDPLPPGWIREVSTTIMGKYYFTNTATKEVAMQHPKSKKAWNDAPPPWQFVVSKTDKSVCYWIDLKTKQTTTVHPITGIDVRKG